MFPHRELTCLSACPAVVWGRGPSKWLGRVSLPSHFRFFIVAASTRTARVPCTSSQRPLVAVPACPRPLLRPPGTSAAAPRKPQLAYSSASPSPPPRPRRQRDGARKVTTAAHHLPPLLPLSTPLAPHFDPSRPAALPRPPLPPPASPPLSPPLPSPPARPPRPLRTLLHDVPRRALPPLVD